MRAPLPRGTSLIAAPGRYFVTTDNPVVLDTYQGLQNSLLFFPLSSSLLLDAFRLNSGDLTYEQAPLTRRAT